MTQLLNTPIAAPGRYFGQPFTLSDPKQRFLPQNSNVELLFSYGSGGTSVDVILQTSHDGGTWKDTVRWAQLTTSSKRAIWRASASDSVLDPDTQFTAPSLSWWRVRYVVVGNYANTSLTVTAIGADLIAAGPF
jgi:hypothetical protein